MNDKQKFLNELKYSKELVEEYQQYLAGTHNDYFIDEDDDEDDTMTLDEFVELVKADIAWENSKEFQELFNAMNND